MDLSYDWDVKEKNKLYSKLDNICWFTHKFETERNAIRGIKVPKLFFKKKVLDEKKYLLRDVNARIENTYDLRRKILFQVELIDSGRYSCRQEYEEFIEKDLKKFIDSRI